MQLSNTIRFCAIIFALLAGLLASESALSKLPPFTQSDCADPAQFLELRTQAQIDTFPCATVAGDLRIDPKSTITSLSPGLDSLTRVEGLLALNFQVTFAPPTLDGLGNLTHVGSLRIRGTIWGGTDQLNDISALSGLASLGPRNCQPYLGGGECLTALEISSSEITQLPAWAIAGETNLEYMLLRDGFTLTDPTEFSTRLPIPTKDLTFGNITLDTDNSGQLASLQRLASQAQRTVRLEDGLGIKTLPTMPNTARLFLVGLGLADLSSITPVSFPALNDITLERLPNIDGGELVRIRDISRVSLSKMDGLAGGNPLSGLTGGTLNTLFLTYSPNVTTLTDLTSVTMLTGFGLSGLDGLINLDGLQNLTSITKFINISKNPNLVNLDGLANLASVGESIVVEENAALQNLDGLGGVTGSLQRLSVIANGQLTDISGLKGISGVSQVVTVVANLVTECDVLVQSRLNPAPPAADYYVVPACVYSTPNLVSSESTLDFGSGSIGTTIDRSVTLQNATGSISTTTNISAIAIAGDALNEYSILSENCTTTPLTGGSTRNVCTVTVRFTVNQTGVDQAQLGLVYTTSDNNNVSTLPVNLTAAGTGVAGDQLTPNTNLDFDQVELGATSTKTITIDNTGGSAPLTVSSLNATGSDFSLVGNSCGNSYPQSVAIGSQCVVTVRFTPSVLAAGSGQFTMASNGASSPDNVNLLGVGVAAPAPVPSPSSLDFGDVVRGTTAVQTLTVNNAGAIRGLPLGQLGATTDFAVQSDNCSGTTLAPAGQSGASCTVDVVFAPTATGPATGTLNIPGASGFPSSTVVLSGKGFEPAALQATPTHLAFGTQTSLATLDVTITNIGAPGQDAQVGAATVLGSLTPIQFGIASDTCSSSTLAGQATCQISVVFDPTQDGADTGSLVILYNGGQKTLNVALSGRGGEPVDYITPASLSFDNVEIGTISAARTVTVTDNSGIALDIASVTSSAAVFSVKNDTCSGTKVNPSGSCTFDVVFNALSSSHEVGTIELISNSASSPDQIAVDGNGVTPPELHLSEPAVDFGPVNTGVSKDETVTVTNYGDKNLVIGALSLNAGTEFSIAADACSGATLAAGANCAFTVTYAPTTAASTTGSVTLPSNATNSPSTLRLMGEGALTAPVQIPTLSDWARLMLIILIAFVSIGAIRRKSVAGS